jgi:hypothetical protein
MEHTKVHNCQSKTGYHTQRSLVRQGHQTAGHRPAVGAEKEGQHHKILVAMARACSDTSSSIMACAHALLQLKCCDGLRYLHEYKAKQDFLMFLVHI